MKEKIRELRTMLPIPMMEAKQLLEDNDGDIETCVLLYAAKAIKEIMDATGATKEVADARYRKENFDINRSIFMIKEDIYDANYQPIVGIDHASLNYIKDWAYAMETHGFGTSLSYKFLAQTIETMKLIPKLKKIAEQLEQVKQEYDIIFDGYSESSPLEDFVKRNRQLDDVLIFQEANDLIPLQVLYIKNEVSRHWRNV